MRYLLIFFIILVGCSTTESKNEDNINSILSLARTGDKEAIHIACYRFLYGEGAAQSNTNAYYWCKKSAEANLSSGQTLYAEIYYSGLGVPKNYQKAIYWYTKAARNNHPHAMLMLFYIYIDGKGVESNPGLAYIYLKRAADLGYDKAIEILNEINKKAVIEV